MVAGEFCGGWEVVSAVLAEVGTLRGREPVGCQVRYRISGPNGLFSSYIWVGAIASQGRLLWDIFSDTCLNYRRQGRPFDFCWA